jgi:hypothetical protein
VWPRSIARWSLDDRAESGFLGPGTANTQASARTFVATPGNGSIAAGAVLVAFILLYAVFGLECSALLGCYVTLPAILLGFDAVFLALVVLVLGIMLITAGAIRRARSRLPAYIV